MDRVKTLTLMEIATQESTHTESLMVKDDTCGRMVVPMREILSKE
jgi:hypothetical protein